jgi:glyoxylase-like metal-dependent hydrolase (beta-lactamase superfamily II)
MIAERGQEDWDSEYGRFPRLFRAAESIPGLTWPTITFRRSMTLYLGKRRVELRHIGRAHTAGDIVAYVPDANVVFSGDIVEYKSACYCGTRISRTGPVRCRASTPSRPMRWCPGAATRWSARILSPRPSRSPATSCAIPTTR